MRAADKHWIAAVLLFIAFGGLGLVVARAAEADEASDVAGLTLTIEPLSTTRPKLSFPDARNVRLVALHVPQGAAPSDFTAAGPFRATFEGDISVRLRTYVRFSAQGRGKLTLTIGGKPVLESSGDDLSKTTSDEVRLSKGKNHIVALYESPQSGDATVRLLWLSKTWTPEPVPPNVLSHAAPHAEIARSLQVREGRFLLAQYRCLKCHSGPNLQDKKGMPELTMDVPSLAEIGARLNGAWIGRWVADPHSLRPDAHMPRLLGHGADAGRQANDIAAYLATLGKPTESSVTGEANNGGRIFANLDCIACHTAPDAKLDPARVTLAHVGQKFRPAALREYLLNPQAHYAWNPMPNFRLSEQEASNLAAYLEASSEKEQGETAQGDPAKGKALVTAVGCLNCHSLGTDRSSLQAPSLGELTKQSPEKGCLAAMPEQAGKAPDFAFSADQRTALSLFLETSVDSLKNRCAPEFAERQIAAMRCTACHARDGAESLLGQGLDADSQALHQKFPNPPVTEKDLIAADQHPPMLTWAGEKLRPQWMGRFIGGQIPYKPRYYLRARMPGFAARAELIAAGLAEEQGYSASPDPVPAPDAQQAEIGRTLSGKTPNRGFSCVQCHAIGDMPPFAAFEAPSINFKYVADRLRHEYYTRWVLNPQRIDPNTKMPRFGDDEGKTGLPALDHDAAKQFEAIWQYLLEAEHIQPPPG